MRKSFKKISKTIGLHHIAASIQEQRRNFLRQLGRGSKDFQLTNDISFPIDIAAKRAFQMFTDNDPDMRLEIERFVQLVRGKKCLLDIGSLFGIFSLTFTTLNQNGKSFAIEPSPKCFKVLKLNRKLNLDKDINPINLALGSKNGQLDMHYEWVHLIANHKNPERQSIQVEMTTLDQFVDSNKIKPDIIKIDVDGYEGPVISGGHNFLSKSDPIIFLELHGDWIMRYGHTPNSIANTLKEYGYHFLDLDLQPITNEQLTFSIFANRIICVKNSDRISP